MALSAGERTRYHRHLNLPEFGAAGQERLKAARILIVGTGGLGCPAALYLAAAGVGTLGLVDFDRVELSNLQRQVLFANDDVGRLKVEVARERLLALNPEVTVIAMALRLGAQNVRAVLKDYDIVLDGSDRLSTRYLISDACVLLGKALVTAAIHRFEGQAMTYVPGQGPCYRCLFLQGPADGIESCAEAGVLGVLPGVLGALQASEAVKLASGIGAPLLGRLLTYDALGMSFTELPVSRRAECPACGEHPSITVPEEIRGSCEAQASSAAQRLSAREVRELMASCRTTGPGLRLIDVREPWEFHARHLDGACNIPLGELEGRLGECAGEGPLVFICRSGQRSLAACALALRVGIASPGHLDGGLLAWSEQIDPNFTL